ncbi:MAG: amino acid adenylation domain-containing protein [Candidatus Rokubacteria bacterium]|nr:amino acid adenylation domain-containing protein [Candidatus Rokubacteria bacterium]
MERLHEWITRHAAQRPDAAAVVLGGDRVTYGELEHRSNQLARLLRDGGCAPGDRVCLLSPKSPIAIMAIIGIYKADCAFVPLDPASPPARLAKIVESCEPRWLLAAGPVAAAVDALLGDGAPQRRLPVGWLDAEAPPGTRFAAAFVLGDLAGYPAAPRAYRHSRRDPAHILFTSGSTGTPKGVVITHGNVIHFVQWALKYFGLSASDRNSGHSPLHFDLSTFDIFGTFAAGAELHLVPAELNLLPHRVAEFIRRAELTQWFSVPSILNHMAKVDAVRPGDFPGLRRLLWCGEVFPTPGLIYWMARLPHVQFTNLYGPTEATIASSYYTVPKCPDDPRAPVPIGTGCDGEELLVLDERLAPVPPGRVGDLYIRGVGLSPGYWRDPERTREVFIPDPDSPDPADRLYRSGDLARMGEDGFVYFLGRGDSQIKSRGYRIELGEIEAALGTLRGLEEFAVVAVPTDGFEGTAICCAYAPAPGAEVPPRDARTALSRLVPPYMLPTRWLVLDRLPHNANGKIDRRRLQERFQGHAASAD